MGNIEDYEGVFDEGEIQQTNTQSTVKGSDSFNITKAEVMKNPKGKRFKYLLNTFLKAGRMKSVNNDFMLQLYFHAMMGAYLKRYSVSKTAGYTDMRIPLIWIQNSGTGKSQMNKMTIDAANKIGIKATEVTYFSEAGLIGTYDRKAHEYNVTNNLSKFENPQNEKGKVYKDPVVRGDLFYYDLVFIDEGKILFQKNSHAENILSILQPALDFPGRVRKKLAGTEPVEYDCDSTLIISTVPFRELNPELMLQGFFPRCLFYQKNIGINERLQNMRQMNTIFDEVAYNKLLDDMSSVITNPKDDFAIGRDRLKVKVKDPLVVDMINETTEKWFLMSRDYTGTESKVLQAIISRLNVFIFKIAGQMAVIDEEVDETDKGAYKSFLIKPNHVQYAIDLLDKVLIELRKKMSFKKSKEDQSSLFRYQKITNAFVEHNKQSVNKKELIALYLNLFKTNKQRAIKMFEEDYTNNLFITKKSKGGYQYKLNSRLINEYGLNMVGENEDDN